MVFEYLRHRTKGRSAGRVDWAGGKNNTLFHLPAISTRPALPARRCLLPHPPQYSSLPPATSMTTNSGSSYGCSARSRGSSSGSRTRVVLITSWRSASCSTAPFHRYVDVIGDCTLTHAARRSSTSGARARRPLVVRHGRQYEHEVSHHRSCTFTKVVVLFCARGKGRKPSIPETTNAKPKRPDTEPPDRSLAPACSSRRSSSWTALLASADCWR